MRELRQRALTGAPGVLDSLDRVAGADGMRVVVRELADVRIGVDGIYRGDRVGNAPVESRPTRGAHFVVERGAEQRVREHVVADADLPHDAGVDRGVEELGELVGVHLGELREDGELEAAADDRGELEQLVGLVGEPVQPAPDHFAHALGDPDRLDVADRHPHPVTLDDRAGFREVTQHLAREQRVAVGLGEDQMRERDTPGL